MITYTKNWLLILLGVSVLSLAVNLTPVIAASGIILIRSTGTVEIKSYQPDSWKPISSGTILSYGDVIRTGPQSKAEISFEGGAIGMYENTVLEIPSKFQQLQVSNGGQKLKNVFLMEGRSLFKVFKNRLQNGFEVTTPSIIAGVKGTTFSVSEEEGNKGVAVMEGAVVVTNRVHPKESTEVRSGHFVMLKDEHLAPAREFRDQNDLRLQEKRLKDVQSRRDRQEKLKDQKNELKKDQKNDLKNDLKKEAQDRTGTGGFTLPGTTGKLASGAVDPLQKSGSSGIGGSRNSGSGSSNSGSGNSGPN